MSQPYNERLGAVTRAAAERAAHRLAAHRADYRKHHAARLAYQRAYKARLAKDKP